MRHNVVQPSLVPRNRGIPTHPAKKMITMRNAFRAVVIITIAVNTAIMGPANEPAQFPTIDDASVVKTIKYGKQE